MKQGQGLKKQITERQLIVICFAGLLSPLIRVAPGGIVGVAGKAAWLSPLLALAPALVLFWLLRKGLSKLPEGGLGELLQAGYGKVLGTVICALDGFWLFGMLCVTLRFNAERFLSSTYREASILLFLSTTLLLALWQSRKSLPAFARLAQIFFFPLTILLGVVLILAVKEGKSSSWLPIWIDDLLPAVEGMLPMLGILALAVGGAFLYGRVDRASGMGKVGKWTAAFGLLAAAISAVTIAVFGAGISGRLQTPFFSLAKEIRISDAMERMESLMVTVWVLSDLVLVLLLLKCVGRAFEICVFLPEEERGILEIPIAFAVLPCAILCGKNAWIVEEQVAKWMVPIGVILLVGGTVLGALLVIAKGRKGKRMRQ